MINYDDYKIFSYTKKVLQKRFGNTKYFNILAYLFQNSFNANCSEKELEEQLLMYNFFKTEEDFKELLRNSSNNSSFEIGKNIIIEEVFEVLKDSSFIKDVISSETDKSYSELFYEKIIKNINRLEDLFDSNDLEIIGAFKKLNGFLEIKQKIEKIKKVKNFKLPVWFEFKSFRPMLYSFYIKNTKQKVDVNKTVLISNVNKEIYGSSGFFLPNSCEIKAANYSSVGNIKTIKETTYNKLNIISLKIIIDEILKDTKNNILDKENEEYFSFLKKWYKKPSLVKEDLEKVKRITINILLNGVLELLKLKHNLNMLPNDNRNSTKADNIKFEFIKILEFCKIDKNYLL